MKTQLSPFSNLPPLAAFATLLFATILTAAEPVRFSRDILPILSDNCFHCHGPDAKSRQADLRLDTEDGALRKESPVIVAGKSDASELVKRLLSSDPDEVMPPPSTKKNLSAEQIALLKRWIDEGAGWGKHWAFETPRRPALPDVKRTDWVRNPLDAFILARLEQEGLTPSPEADKAKLLRRVTLDLTGLPPTPAELEAYLADSSPAAYEHVVDRLFRSPRYGERMVWEWLEAARYADTNGYQGDPTRSMYYWRDWAIEALNANMPFDQFTIEQLAGDLLPNATQAQQIATGFHRNHMINGEGGRIAEESRVDYVQDRVETTGAVWLALTFNCCRCHDHKFDPLKQAEYYQLSAYFNSIDESGGNDAGGLANPLLSFSTPEQVKEVETLKQAEQLANKTRDEIEKKLRDELPQWEAALIKDGKPADIVWHALSPEAVTSANGTDFERPGDGVILAKGKNPPTEEYSVVVKTKGGLTGFRLEALADEAFANRGPGRADNGNFVLNEVKLTANEQPIALTGRGADFSQQGWDSAGAFDGKSGTGWAVMPEFGKTHTVSFTPKEPVGSGDADVTLTFKLSFQFGREHTLGKFRFLATNGPAELLIAMPDDVRAILAKPTDQRNESDRKRLGDFRRDADTGYVAAKKAAEEATRKRNDTEKAQPRTMVMRERKEPRETFILDRGVYTKPLEKVAHGVPAVFPPLPADAPANRLALAQWLMSPEHPLTARVAVNRTWQQFFGIGIVKTAEDFGVQSERPSHPELLDWLACEFQTPQVSQPSVANERPNNAWNVKHLQRLIVTSAAYRQSSVTPPGLAERDPANRLLARGPRFRLPSWMIRDQALAASGLLVEKQGGPPVKGYQPTGVWEEATFGQIRYAQDQGDALYRRSLYQFWRRIVGPTVFFDTPGRQACQVKAGRTNTPLHALVTLNDVTYVEAARLLAEKMLQEGGATPEERLAFAFKRLVSRPPTADETKILLGLLAKSQARFEQEPKAAEALLKIGEAQRNAKLPAAEHAAYTTLCNVLLNLDETLTKE